MLLAMSRFDAYAMKMGGCGLGTKTWAAPYEKGVAQHAVKQVVGDSDIGG